MQLKKQTVIQILQHIRRNLIRKRNSHVMGPYKMGNDFKGFHSAYFKIINVSGERLSRVDKTRFIVIKYYTDDGSICSLNINVEKLIPYQPELSYNDI